MSASTVHRIVKMQFDDGHAWLVTRTDDPESWLAVCGTKAKAQRVVAGLDMLDEKVTT